MIAYQERPEDTVRRFARDLQATEQALLDAQAELAHARPVADAAHAYMAMRLGMGGDAVRAWQDLLAAHQAATPSAVPSSHVIVERAHLEWLQRVADAAGELVMAATFDEGSRAVQQLRDELDGVK